MPDQNIKYTLYLDASGDPGWPQPWGISPNKFYIIGGIVLDPVKESVAVTDLKTIVEKHFENIQKPDELKYAWVVNGGKTPFNLLDETKRKNLADDIFLLIKRLEPKILCTVVDKEKLKRRYGERAFDPKTYAILSTLVRFSMTLKREKKFGEVIMDDENAVKDKQLQEFINKRRKHGAILRGLMYNPLASEKLEPLINSLLFTKSEDSAGIQLADFAIKTVWFKYAYGKDRRFSEIQHLFDKSPSGKQYEPCLIPQ